MGVVATVAGMTRTGLLRHANEDGFYVGEAGGTPRYGPDDLVERLALGSVSLGVFDGMGSGQEGGAGATAARMVGNMIGSLLAGEQPDPARALTSALVSVGASIHAHVMEALLSRGMGSTATAAVISGDEIVVAQVGDSRGYVLRERVLVQVTRDDTLLEEALRTGTLRPQDVAVFPHKNVLLKVLGAAPSVEVAVTGIAPRCGDVLLLCTDGIHGRLDRATLRAVLLRHREPGAAARVLVQEAMRAGGNDDATVVVARIAGESLPPPGPDDVLEERGRPLP